MSANTLTDAVYNCIFPGGLIPIRCKDNIAAIDARIQEIEELATGKIIEGMNRRIKGREASQRLTDQIVALRDSCSPPMSYREIMRRLGNVITPDAARNRYDDFKAVTVLKIAGGDHIVEPNEKVAVAATDGKGKEIGEVFSLAAPPALQEAKPEQVDEATNRNSRIVQESEEVKPDETLRNVAATSEIEKEATSEATKQPQNGHIVADLTKKDKYDRYEVPIPKEVEDEISRLYSMELNVRQISDALANKGIQISWRRVRGQISNAAKKAHAPGPERTSEPRNVAPVHPEATTSPSLPGVEGAPEAAARANPRGTPEEEPEPRFISRRVLDEKVWALHKAGKDPAQISDALCSEGYYYGKDRVKRMLIQQGAEL